MTVVIHPHQTHAHTRYLVFYSNADVYVHGAVAMIQAIAADRNWFDCEIDRVCVVTPDGSAEPVRVRNGGPANDDFDYWEIFRDDDFRDEIQVVAFKPGTWHPYLNVVLVDGWDTAVHEHDNDE